MAFLARTDWFVVFHVADGVGAAVAGISALSIDAGVAIAALVIRSAGADGCYLNWK